MISKGKTVKLIYALKFKHICMDHAHTHPHTNQTHVHKHSIQIWRSD